MGLSLLAHFAEIKYWPVRGNVHHNQFAPSCSSNALDALERHLFVDSISKLQELHLCPEEGNPYLYEITRTPRQLLSILLVYRLGSAVSHG